MMLKVSFSGIDEVAARLIKIAEHLKEIKIEAERISATSIGVEVDCEAKD